jgi:serine/threonine protein phosphatase PrpC
VEYATAYDVGDRKRGAGINEDSVAVLVVEEGHREGLEAHDEDAEGVTESAGQPNRSVVAFALADGAGGYDAGDVASYLASTVVVESLAPLAVRAGRSDPEPFGVDLEAPLPDPPDAVEYQAAIDEAVQTAHRDVLRYADESGETSLTTVVAGIAARGELHYGWVGDSRAYVCNAVEETVEQLTKDHRVVTELADAGEIDDVEAHVHPRGNEITNALGGHPGEDPPGGTVPVETHTVPLFAEDVVLVTSDGLIDAQTDAADLHERYLATDRSEAAAAAIRDAVVTDAEIGEVVFGAESLEAAADRLIDLGNERGGKDNLSTLLFRDEALPATPGARRFPTRAIDPDEPVEDRSTVIVPDE